ESLRIVGRRLHDHLVLVVVLEAERILAIAAVGRTARRLDVSGLPWLGAERAEERVRVQRAGALLHVVRLDEEAADLLRPVMVELQDHFLEREHDGTPDGTRGPRMLPS